MNEPSRIITPAPARTYQAPQLQSDGSDASTLMQVISRAATDPNFDIEKMERLLTMHERIRETQAKAAFQDALAQMQPELPLIQERGSIKNNAGNVQSKYAYWEDIVTQITPILSKYGFGLSFKIANTDKAVTVTAILMHRMGHREESPFTLPMDTSGSKNAVQAAASSVSYGKRYTAGALLNLRTGEIDNDGASNGCVNADQIANIEALLTEVNASKDSFLRTIKASSIESIKAASYPMVVGILEAKRKKS